MSVRNQLRVAKELRGKATTLYCRSNPLKREKKIRFVIIAPYIAPQSVPVGYHALEFTLFTIATWDVPCAALIYSASLRYSD